MSKLVIAEKPMLARDIARAITGKEVSESARLPISGNGYTVCACAGHLLELVKPDAIDPKWGMPWSLDVLPIEVHDWPKEPAVDKKTGESKKPLIDQIAGLLKTCDSVIAAGDPDDEGQLIVDELLDYLGYAGKVERVYVNDNIEKNIVKAFDKLVPNDSCRGAGNAAYARQMADMCFGVNETRLATKRLDGLFTVGRGVHGCLPEHLEQPRQRGFRYGEPMGSRRKPHPCRYLLLNHGRGDHPARTLYGGHPHHRHGIHREVRQRPGNPGNP